MLKWVVVPLVAVVVVTSCAQPDGRCASAVGGNKPVPPPAFDCTADLKGSFVCPRGQVGWGYMCTGQCWSFMYDGPCVALPLQEDGGSQATPPCADGGVPSLSCPGQIEEGSVICNSEGDFQCVGGCWTRQPGRCFR